MPPLFADTPAGKSRGGFLHLKKSRDSHLGIFSTQNIVRLLNRDNAYFLAVAAHALEFYLAIFESEQGIVAADAAVGAGMNVGAALTVQDVARQDELAVRTLRAEALRLAVAAVVGRTGALLMSEELKIHRKHLLASILLAVSE